MKNFYSKNLSPVPYMSEAFIIVASGNSSRTTCSPSHLEDLKPLGFLITIGSGCSSELRYDKWINLSTPAFLQALQIFKIIIC